MNPIALTRDTAVKAKKIKKLNPDQLLQIIAEYLTRGYVPSKPRKTKIICKIDDNEARAAQRLVLDIQGQSEILDDWMDAIIGCYFHSCSCSELVIDYRSQLDVRMGERSDLAALHSRYELIDYV